MVRSDRSPELHEEAHERGHNRRPPTPGLVSPTASENQTRTQQENVHSGNTAQHSCRHEAA